QRFGRLRPVAALVDSFVVKTRCQAAAEKNGDRSPHSKFRPLRRNRLLARFAASVFWQGFSFNYSLTRRPIENGITKKLFGCPRRRIPAQVFVEPLDVRRVVKRHFVPARPVSGV